MASNRYHLMESAIGQLMLLSDGNSLTGLYMKTHKETKGILADAKLDNSLFAPIVNDLRAYFAGEIITDWHMQLDPRGTPFQQRVWTALRAIPHGKTVSYKYIADQVGNHARPVGMANNRNPISIIIPCHRVIGSNGKMVGYGGGLPQKEWLLKHEAQAT